MMEGDEGNDGGEKSPSEKKPKLRSWARNRAAASPQAQATTTVPDSPERSWVTRRKQGVQSLEDMAAKYKKLREDQEAARRGTCSVIRASLSSSFLVFFEIHFPRRRDEAGAGQPNYRKKETGDDQAGNTRGKGRTKGTEKEGERNKAARGRGLASETNRTIRTNGGRN